MQDRHNVQEEAQTATVVPLFEQQKNTLLFGM